MALKTVTRSIQLTNALVVASDEAFFFVGKPVSLIHVDIIKILTVFLSWGMTSSKTKNSLKINTIIAWFFIVVSICFISKLESKIYVYV